MLVYLAIVLIFCAIYPLVNRRYIKWLFGALVLALSIMAFFAVPAETDDLYRYYTHLENFRDGGPQRLFEMIINNESDFGALPICGVYYYIASLFPHNGMLAAMTIFLAYGSMFLVLWRAAKKFNVDKGYLFLAAFFLLSTYWFYDICSGIRNGLVFTLFCAFLYFDVVEKKFRPLCWLGYIVLMGIHSSAILIIAIRLAMILSGRGKGKLMSILMVVVMIAGGAVIPHIGDITGIEYLQLISDKAQRATETTGVGTKTYYFVNISVFIIACIVALYCLYIINKSDNYDDFNEYKKFVQFLLCFMLGALFFELTFIRFARWIIPAVISVVFMVGMQANAEIRMNMYKERGKKSVIKSGSVLTTNELVMNFVFMAYSCVHLWYACTGSSLIWLHFS